MIWPGAVFELPAKLAQPPQRAYQDNPPHRHNRWVLIISSEADCHDPECPNVLTVLLSTRTDLAGPCDVDVVPPNGGVTDKCIAQTDIVVTIDKRDISGPVNGPRFRGTVLDDTLAQVHALLRARLDLE